MRASFIQTLTRLFYPSRCLGCGQYGTALCDACVQKIPPAPFISDHDHALFDYGNKTVRSAIWQFKYHHAAGAARVLARHGASYLAELLSEVLLGALQQDLILVPVPQHRQKTNARGYNQSLLLANWFAAHIPGARVELLLKKTVPTLPQARSHNKSARMRNVAHSMCATQALDPQAVYMVVDDVTTTGATVNEGRRALRAYGGKKILSVSLAHGYLSA